MPPKPIKYDLHPSVEQIQGWIATLPDKTGRSLDQWMAFIRKAGHADEKAARAWLKGEHGLGTNTAWWLCERAFARDLSMMDDDPDRYMAMAPKYVAGQYAGKKEALRPIYARLVSMARRQGKDVKVCPCKTMVPFYRAHVFANVKPTTTTRVDLGLCLTPLVKAGKKLPARLVATGGYEKKDRITHRVALAGVGEIDEFVEKWLGKAYELDG